MKTPRKPVHARPRRAGPAAVVLAAAALLLTAACGGSGRSSGAAGNGTPGGTASAGSAGSAGTTNSAAGGSAVGSGYDTPGGAGRLGPASPGDSVTRAQVLARAHDWIDAHVAYAQNQGWQDAATGGPYRMDCSGFVSMAWGLGTSLLTSTMTQAATVTDQNASGDTNLAPGDALDYTGDHVVLFDHWIGGSGDFAYDAEHTFGYGAGQSTGNIDDSLLEGFAMSDFEAMHYNDLSG